ncbi:MAG: alpha/beta fold hydrolase [Jatrophihabitantaceae bacterium]
MLAFERHGSGEPLVLVHGLTHRRQAWYPVLDQLAERREVILVDLPGHGQSPPFCPGARPVTDVLSELFREFLADQGLVRPNVAGYSLGGRVALEAGARGDARSVVAFSPAGFWRTDAEFAYTRRIFTSAAALVERLGPRAEWLARSRAGRKLVYGILMAHPGRVDADHALGDIRGFAYARPSLSLLLDAATPFTGDIAPEIPVTIGWAARDLVLPPWQAEIARRAVPQAEHLTMRGVGHVPMWDAPDYVARIILRGTEPAATVAPLQVVGSSSRSSSRRRAAAASA